MAFPTLDFQAIRDGYLRDIVNQQRLINNVDPNVGEGSDYWVRGNATGCAVEGLYQHQAWIVRQLFADTADDDYVEKHAGLRGLTRKAATTATGTVLFSGTVGSPVPAGTEVKTAGGVNYLTTVDGSIGAGGTVAIAALAVAVGVAGNQAASVAMTLTAAPAGVLSTASIVTMTGGTDIETIASLLSRLLFVLRNPPCGGAAHDYYTWAMNVPGVTAAYVYPNRRGIGTVDVIIMTAGGLPGAGLIAAAQAYIDTQRPVQADFLVFGPVAVTVNVAAALTLAAGYTVAAVGSVIGGFIAAYFATLKPGDTAYLNRLRALISDTPGVIDYNLTAPTANTVSLVDATHTQLCVLGSTTWS